MTMKEPPTLHHLSRYLNEMIAFCSEVPAGTIPVHKMEDRTVAQFSRIPELATDMVQYMRLPWVSRSWINLVEVVRHFPSHDEIARTHARKLKQFERAEQKNTHNTPPAGVKPKGPPAGPISALPSRATHRKPAGRKDKTHSEDES